MRMIDNSRNLGNMVYITALTHIEGALNILRETDKVFSPDYLNTIDLEDYEGLSDIEIRYTLLEDVFNTFSTRDFNLITLRIGEGTYFESTANTLFLSSLENFKFWYSKLKSKMDFALSINYEVEFSRLTLNLLKDLNYCVVNCFQLYLTEKEEGVQSCITEYCALNSLNEVSFAKQHMDYFREHRPNQPLFIQYPELVDFLEENVEDVYLYDLIYLSTFLTKAEVEGILNRTVTVDGDFIDELKERTQEIISGI